MKWRDEQNNKDEQKLTKMNKRYKK